jgi:uncharacterized protein (DUF1330 family)
MEFTRFNRRFGLRFRVNLNRGTTMNAKYKIAVALLAGVAIGGAAIQTLHAQAKPQGIVVVDISDITDPDGFKAIGQRSNDAAAAVFKELGGRYLARTSNITAVDGTPPKRFIIIAFDSVEKAKAWNEVPGQGAVNAVRMKTTKSRSFIVEGM